MAPELICTAHNSVMSSPSSASRCDVIIKCEVIIIIITCLCFGVIIICDIIITCDVLSFSPVLWSVLTDTVCWSNLVRSRYYGTRAYLHRSQLSDVITTIITICDVIIIIIIRCVCCGQC